MSTHTGWSRRGFLAASVAVVAGGVCGCGERGPEHVAWGTDSCAFCGSPISDPRFAAQVRGPKNQVWKFDDCGCAIKFLAGKPWGEDPAAEIWVGNSTLREGGGAAWLDGRTAGFVPGIASPQGYDYGAVPRKVEGALDFKAFRAALLEKS